ncbi:MAG: hypothetical protein PPFGHCPK_01421 (plasmid) [Spiroplasma endosymbiont of Drosophila atripex]|nr:MAG: hypothetical protein PPFGHCPK_01421 [Spiroplasma endosymbiont of Drosophila atripex]
MEYKEIFDKNLELEVIQQQAKKIKQLKNEIELLKNFKSKTRNRG